MGPAGEKYIVSFIDHHSRYAATYCTAGKRSSTILKCFKHFEPWLERNTDSKLKILRTDGGGEYKGELL